MFHKLQSVIKNAVDALAPELPSHENFVFHWKSVTNYFIESTDDKVPVQSTNIPYSLEHMLETLRVEDQENGGSTAGPCLEYLLQHKILETLHTLGKADCPPGMKQQVLQFFTNLLGKIKTPLLPHVNVHKPIHRLIHVCGQIQAAPSESEEVQFLCTVAAKLRMYPNLVNFFLEMPYQASSTPANVSSPMSKHSQQEKPQYSLVKSLLQLSKSEDRRIAVKACEGLMLCSSIPDDHAASVIILYTPFCEVMVDCLTGLFQNLPKEMESADIANIVAKWGLDRNEGGTHNFPGKRHLLSFLSWLDYIDQLIRESHQLIGKALSSALRERCLEGVFKPSLLEISESRVITVTALLTKCLGMVNAPKTIEEFVSFFMETSTDELKKENDEEKGSLIDMLIKRCNHISDNVTIETLRLLECLLQKPVVDILDSLVLKHLADRKYFKLTTVANGDTTQVNGDVKMSRDEDSKVDELDRIELEKIVNSFLFLLPGEVKSSAELGDNGYDSYLRDAHRQCAERRNQCKTFHWPKTTMVEGTSDGDFYEGDFLNILFKKLKNILDQPYDVNLQVTSVLALLSQFPHPHLHEYLLNPTLSLTPGATSLSNVLREISLCFPKIVKDLKDRVQRLPNFKQRLLHTRKRLMSLQSIENKSEPQLNLLQGVVVLEEFCKELAAIAFVKATNTIKER